MSFFFWRDAHHFPPSVESFTLYSSARKTSVEVPINKALLQKKKKKGKEKSIVMLCELLSGQQEQTVAVKVCKV